MKIIYIGTDSFFSIIPFQTLLQSQHEVCALAFDDDLNSDFNTIKSESIQSFALKNSIPFIKLNSQDSDAESQMREYQPDIILVSCYARLLPQSILSLARKVSINIHPSLLPAYRGPNPLFWQFRDGVENFGVTLHRMTADFDAGNIISQKTVKLDDGVSINEGINILANVASDLMLVTLNNIQNGQFHETVQNSLSSSYQSFPTETDYTVSRMWTAKKIYNFISAYKDDNVTFMCDIGIDKIKISDAYSYQDEPYHYMNGKTELLEEGVITFACKTGYIRCQVKMD